MIAFDIYLNDQLLCRAGLTGKHLLTANVHIMPAENDYKSNLMISGNEMNKNALLSQPLEKPVTKEKFMEMVHSVAQQGMKNWGHEKLESNFKIDIEVVDVPPESITPPETVTVDLANMGPALEGFTKLFPDN